MFKAFIVLIFFATGFNSLTYQVIWNKVLSQTIGADYFSNILIVSIFMLGLGLGGHIGALITKKSKKLLRWFLSAEIFVAIFGVLSINLIKFSQKLSAYLANGDLGLKGILLDSILNFFLLLIPTILMGASLPMVTHLFRDKFKVGTTVAFLYSINILGAVFGALLSGIYLIGTIGLQGAAYLSSAIILVLLVPSLVFSSAKPEVGVLGVLSNEKSTLIRKHIFILALSFCLGVLALAYEILYFRLFVSYFSATSYVFPIVLSVYLLLTALGNTFAGIYIHATKSINGLMFIAVAGGLACTPIIFLGPKFLPFFDMSLGDLYFRTYFGSKKFEDYALIVFLFSTACMLPVFFMSMIFPTVVHSITKDRAELGQSVGKVFLVQTYGNFIGSLVMGFLLIPILGSVNAAKFLVIGYALVGVFFIAAFSNWAILNIKAIISTSVILMISVSSINQMDNNFFYNFTLPSGEKPVRIKEDKEGTALIYGPISEVAYRVNIGAEPSTTYPMANKGGWHLWPLDVALATLNHSPKRILIIGIGAATQPLMLHMLYPDAEIVVVELLDVLISEMREYGTPELKDMLDKATVYVTDGRRFVNKSRITDNKSFDYIQIGVFRTTTAGAGNLFTREFH